MSELKKEVNKYLIALQEGDATQFAEFYERKRADFGLFAARILFNKDNWEDVLSESYIKISTRIDTFQRWRDGYNWVLKIIENTAKDVNMRESKYQLVELENLYIDKAYNPYEQVESVMDLEYALKDLDESYTTVAKLYFGAGRTETEIAAMMGISKSAICQRIKKIERTYLEKKNK